MTAARAIADRAPRVRVIAVDPIRLLTYAVGWYVLARSFDMLALGLGGDVPGYAIGAVVTYLMGDGLARLQRRR